MRQVLVLTGLMNLQRFVSSGGVLMSAMDTSEFAVTYNFTPGVSAGRPQRLRAIGDILRMKTVDAKSPLAYGYGDSLAMYAFQGPIFNVSNTVGGGGGGRRGGGAREQRTTGRGTPDDPETPQGRPPAEAPEMPKAEIWEPLTLTEEQRRNNGSIFPHEQRPQDRTTVV